MSAVGSIHSPDRPPTAIHSSDATRTNMASLRHYIRSTQSRAYPMVCFLLNPHPSMPWVAHPSACARKKGRRRNRRQGNACLRFPGLDAVAAGRDPDHSTMQYVQQPVSSQVGPARPIIQMFQYFPMIRSAPCASRHPSCPPTGPHPSRAHAEASLAGSQHSRLPLPEIGISRHLSIPVHTALTMSAKNSTRHVLACAATYCWASSTSIQPCPRQRFSDAGLAVNTTACFSDGGHTGTLPA